MGSKGRRAGRGSLAALAVFATLVVLLACEGALRVLVAWAPPRGSNGFVRFMTQQPEVTLGLIADSALFRKSDDPALGWEPVPGGSRGPVRINRAGFRGADVPTEPKPGTVRIALIGDSETFGESLRDEETIPGQLERILNAGGGAPAYEVLNFGVIGYNTAQELAWLRKKALAYRPSLVVLYYVFNDPEIHSPIVFAESGWARWSYLYHFIQYSRHALRTLDEQRLAAGSTVSYYLGLHDSVYFEATRAILREMSRSLAERGIPMMLLIAPEIFEVADFGDRYPYAAVHRKLAALASADLVVVDPLPALHERFPDPRRLWVSDFDPHKNGDANAVIADVLARRIRERRGAPEGPAGR